MIETFNQSIEAINTVIWHNYVLYAVLGVGILFTVWTGLCQWRAVTHGVKVTRGTYDDPNDPGAINHFQALSAALSATVGLGNIGGVAIAIAIGGPGAVFWMWIIGFAGMALKTTEVCLSMIYRNTDDPQNPHGGPMFVAKQGFEKWKLGPIGWIVGAIFCVTLLISTVTGGNMFQAWNVGMITNEAFPIPNWLTGVILAVVVATVIIGGIKRIGHVAGLIVPFMCVLYVITGLVVVFMNIDEVPHMFSEIFSSAFRPHEASGAFIGGSAGTAFLWGMKRALFSSEAGQGSSPIAHSAAKTDEPVREAVVAGLEPFIDTIVVCTLTSMVILSSGALHRGGDEASGEAAFAASPTVRAVDIKGDKHWLVGEQHSFRDGDEVVIAGKTELPERNDEAKRISGEWRDGDAVFIIVAGGDANEATDANRAMLAGKIVMPDEAEDAPYIRWEPVAVTDDAVVHWQTLADSDQGPLLLNNQLYKDYVGAPMTAYAINRSLPGWGTWLILIASWLFAISTMISWSYYGEQGVIYLFGEKSVPIYKIIYCILIVVATLPIVETTKEIGNLSDLGTGVMLWANIPIMLIFGSIAMKAYHDYFRRLKSGEMDPPHKAPRISDVVEGKDVE